MKGKFEEFVASIRSKDDHILRIEKQLAELSKQSSSWESKESRHDVAQITLKACHGKITGGGAEGEGGGGWGHSPSMGK
jgi:hypothetical protein